MRNVIVLGLLVLSTSGCATYIPPGARADLQIFAPPDIQAGFDAKPSNPFPANIAVVREQAPAYSNYYLQQRGGTYGHGRYSVILAKEAYEVSQRERLQNLDHVTDLVTINRLLLPATLESDREIRGAASRLRSDLVFLYTFDTSFVDTNFSTTLSVIFLGFAPTHSISILTTCSALVIDTRSGYIYSAYDATHTDKTVSTSWGSRDAADDARRKNEQRAFEKLIDEVVATWPQVIDRHMGSSEPS